MACKYHLKYKFLIISLLFFLFSFENLSILSQICPNVYNLTLHHINESLKFQTLPEDYASHLRKMRLKYFIDLKWKGYDGTNVYYFAETLSDAGYCHTFNLLNVSEIFNEKVLSPNNFADLEIKEHDDLNRTSNAWSPDTGYSMESTLKTYPLRSLESSANLGFHAEITIDSDELTIPCEAGSFGYKILFHNPHEWPEFSKKFIQISHNRKYSLIIKPKVTKTSSALRNYEPLEYEFDLKILILFGNF